MAGGSASGEVAQGNGIVYDGVARRGDKVSDSASEDEAGAGGLFDGRKFWIALRVPMRKEFVQMVQSNGGEVVRLEKHADILIADHARKDAPAGSYSWRFIEQSVKKGRLENLEDHLIKPAAGARPAAIPGTNGSARQNKGPRSKYTQEDDDLLMQWVLRQERKGASINGNKIYQEFAEKHPHHTWHSWRDRWVKKLSYLPKPKINDEDEGPDGNVDKNAPEASGTPTVNQATARKATPNGVAVKKGETAARAKFSKEDDDLLRKYVEEAAAAGQSVAGRKIYMELAEEHPHHTHHSWRDRWVRHLSKRDNQSPSGDDDRAPQSRVESRNQQSPPETNHASVTASGRLEPQKPVVPPEDGEPGELPVSTPANGTEKARTSLVPDLDLLENIERIQELEAKRRLVVAARTIQRYWRGYRARRDLSVTSFQSVVRGALTRIALQDDDDSGGAAPEDEVPDEHLIASAQQSASHEQQQTPRTAARTAAQVFYSDLGDFIHFTKAKINYWPTIQRRVVTLWDIWQAVRAQNRSPELRNWEDIAESLDFDWISFPSVTTELKQCFESNLGEFERVIDEWNNDESEQDESEDELEEAEQGPEQASFRDGHQIPPSGTMESTFASSPPRLQSLKRRLEPEPDAHPTSSPRKRVKYSRDDEIPPTPNEKMATPNHRPGNNPVILQNEISPHQGNAARVSSLMESLEQELPALHQTPTKPRPHSSLITRVAETTRSRQLQARSSANLVDPVPLSFPGRTTKASTPGSQSQRLPDRTTALSQSSRAANTPVRRSMPPPSFHARTQSETFSATRSRLSFSGTRASLQSPSLSRPQRPPPSPDPFATPRSSAATVPAGSTSSSLSATINHFMSMGYPQDIVIQGLKATTMLPAGAGLVMESLMAGDGIPDNHEGIWTRRDDEGLKMVDENLAVLPRDPDAADRKRRAAREQKRLVHKHGVERVAGRRRFLREWKAA